jgi:hypothetical protein
MNFSAGVITKTGQIFGKAFETKLEAENYILVLMEKEELKQARIRNLNTGEEEKII